MGQLNAYRSVGRLDTLEIQDIEHQSLSDGSFHTTYTAKLLVAWGEQESIPTYHELILPYSYRGFPSSYLEDCVSKSAQDVDLGSFWYYFRPENHSCNFDSEDIVRTTANVTFSSKNTAGKYPEYHKIWEDNALKISFFPALEAFPKISSVAGLITSYVSLFSEVCHSPSIN